MNVNTDGKIDGGEQWASHKGLVVERYILIPVFRKPTALQLPKSRHQREEILKIIREKPP